MMLLLDSSPDGDTYPPDPGTWKPEPVPSEPELIGRSLLKMISQPGRLARMQWRALRQFAETTQNRELADGVDRVRAALPRQLGGSDVESVEASNRRRIAAPDTPFNKSITPHRRVAMRSASLDDIKALKTAYDCTVNDVVMAIVAGALRRYLEKNDALPEVPLRAAVPVSLRTGNEVDPWTNRVSNMFTDLPTHLDEPRERILAMKASMEEAKEGFNLDSAETLVELAQFALPAIVGQAGRLAAQVRFGDRAPTPVNVVVSNVPGPRTPLYMGGARMRNFCPISTIAEGVALNVTVQSYLDRLDFGIVGDRELTPDIEDLVDFHLAEIDALFEAAGLDRPSAAKKAPARKKAAEKKKSAKKKAAAKKAPAKKKSAAKKAPAKKKAPRKRSASTA